MKIYDCITDITFNTHISQKLKYAVTRTVIFINNNYCPLFFTFSHKHNLGPRGIIITVCTVYMNSMKPKFIDSKICKNKPC